MVVCRKTCPVKLVTPPPSPQSQDETILPEEPIGDGDDKRCDEENLEEGVEEENLGSKEDEHIKQSEEDGNLEAQEIEAENRGNEEEEHINQEEEEGNKEYEESDNDEQPMQPLGMYFSPSEYCKSIRLGSRCRLKDTLAFMKPFDEVQWFEAHSQFRHVFHMPREPNHMSQGFLMLLLHTAKTEIDTECWFVVNGVPIRYSIREHALLTQFDCNEYPEGYDPSEDVSDKDLEWAKRVFGKVAVKIKDVRDKLMKDKLVKDKKKSKKLSAGDRKKLLILFFLSNVIAAKAKGDGNIHHFLLRMADDVDASETFPWGRYTFESNLEGIKSILRNMEGKVEAKKLKNFSGFITPLEAIPQLARRFRERVTAENVCGRMCKSKFKSSLMKGFPLEDINEELGRLKDITSILEPDDEEKAWLGRVVEEDAVDPGDGFIDPVVNSWRARLIGERKKIFWKQMYDAYVDGRSGLLAEEETVSGVGKDGQSLKETMEKGFQQILEMLGDQNGRIQKLEVSVSELLTRKEGEKVPPPYQFDDDVSYGREAYEEHVSPKETDANVSPKTPEEHVSPMETYENVFAGPSGGNTSKEMVVYSVNTTIGTAVEEEMVETEAVESDDEMPEKEIKKKEPKKKEVKKKETKKEWKMIDKKKETKKPVEKRLRVPSMHQRDPYTAEQNRGKKKKMVKDEDEFAIKLREREMRWEIRRAKWEENGWIVEKLSGTVGPCYRWRRKK